MPQTLRGRVIRNDFIVTGQTCGTENAVAVAVPGPTPLTENIVGATGPTATPYGLESNRPGSVVGAPNPERLVGVAGPP